MLLFIALCDNFFIFFSLISKHLMLLFIKDCAYLNTANAIFQNISCYCLSAFRSAGLSISIISKHLMLLFICSETITSFWFNVFQNISCYCLSSNHTSGIRFCCISKHLMLLFIDLITNYCIDAGIFQNISCYCLSTTAAFLFGRFIFISKHLMLLFIKVKHSREFIITTFQNISCYCLSTAEHLNTVKKWYFKTSHVIVYLSRAGSTLHRSYISKHLMLLFIGGRGLHGDCLVLFQNISCYCLSA